MREACLMATAYEPQMLSLISNDLGIFRFMGAMRVFVRENLILAGAPWPPFP
jgi:hypothetical protein